MQDNMIDLIQNGEFEKANGELNNQLLMKVSDAFDQRKKEIAQGLFKEE